MPRFNFLTNLFIQKRKELSNMEWVLVLAFRHYSLYLLLSYLSPWPQVTNFTAVRMSIHEQEMLSKVGIEGRILRQKEPK